MEHRTKLCLAGIIIIVFVGAGAVIIGPSISPPDVRIGFLTNDLHQLALMVALDQGYFDDEGLRIQLLEFANGNVEMAGFAGGSIDIGYLGAAPALLLHINQDIQIRILSGVNQEGSAIVAAPGVTSISDLAGQRVATPAAGNVQDMLFFMAANESGYDLGDFNRVHMSPTIMIEQLGIGGLEGIRAFVAWEPYIALSQDQGIGNILNTSNDFWPGHPCCVLASRLDFLDTRPDVVEKVVRANIRATDFILANQSQAVEIAERWTGISQDVIEDAMSRIVYETSIVAAGYRRYLLALHQTNLLPEDFYESDIDPLLDYIIDPQFLP